MPRMAMCPKCNVPLVSTIVFSGAEFYCLDCGKTYGFLDPHAADETPALLADCEARRVEWDENVGGKLVGRFWLRSCDRCMTHAAGYHEEHATDAEREADEAARAWLCSRVKVPA